MSNCSKRGPFIAFCLGFCDSDQVVGKLGACSAGTCGGVCGCATGRTSLGCGAEGEGELDDVGALAGRTKKPELATLLVWNARRAAALACRVARMIMIRGCLCSVCREVEAREVMEGHSGKCGYDELRKQTVG